MFCYTVRCLFSDRDSAVEKAWVEWLQSSHICDVIRAGASSAEIVQMDGPFPSYEIRYRFEDRKSFERYERESAPQLRREGLNRFPLELGLAYQRTSGEVLAEFRASDY
jgi:hypothetical protein